MPLSPSEAAALAELRDFAWDTKAINSPCTPLKDENSINEEELLSPETVKAKTSSTVEFDVKSGRNGNSLPFQIIILEGGFHGWNVNPP